MDELKPCPFCGGKAELEEQNDIFFRAFVVRCQKCGIAQPFPKYETEELATAAWNRRLTMAEKEYIEEDMEIPKDGIMVFAIRTDGMIKNVMGCYVGKAVPVPPHGRLGDLDTLQKQIDFARNSGMLGKTAHYKLQKLIKVAPTIIPADKEASYVLSS